MRKNFQRTLRAISLLEAVVAAALTALFIAGAFSVITTMSSSDISIDVATRQAKELVRSELHRDLQEAVSCGVIQDGQDLVDVNLLGTQAGFYVTDGSGDLSYLLWSYDQSSNALLKSVYNVTDSTCTLDLTPTETISVLGEVTEASFATSGRSIELDAVAEFSGVETQIVAEAYRKGN